eukprot:65769-Chlamydomonas_euryale.AAC.3
MSAARLTTSGNWRSSSSSSSSSSRSLHARLLARAAWRLRRRRRWPPRSTICGIRARSWRGPPPTASAARLATVACLPRHSRPPGWPPRHHPACRAPC